MADEAHGLKLTDPKFYEQPVERLGNGAVVLTHLISDAPHGPRYSIALVWRDGARNTQKLVVHGPGDQPSELLLRALKQARAIYAAEQAGNTVQLPSG